MHRLFDLQWLASSDSSWELVALVSRIDRVPFTPGRCGDVRLIYRLGYRTAQLSSRLPATIAVVLDSVDGDCAVEAQRFRPPEGMMGEALGLWLLGADGPLPAALPPGPRVLSVLSNVQVVRWPSTVMPSLGGHTEYVLRSFRRDDGVLIPSHVDGTPDPEIARSPERRKALREWMSQESVVRAARLGQLVLPEALCDERALTVTPGGFGRARNRVVSETLGRAPLPAALVEAFGSEAGARRRLDEMSCGGCHQAQAIAGFHILGVDGPEVPASAALAVPYSPHVATESERRAAILDDLASGRQPDFRRPMAQRAPGERGLSGAACGLGDAAFADWTCESPLVCRAHGDALLGQCAAAEPAAGEACDLGVLRSSMQPRKDRRASVVPQRCSKGSCVPRKQGFPDGTCMPDTCDALESGEVCAAIASSGFDQCVAQRPFSECLRDKVTDVAVSGCSIERGCRDDYICARTRSGAGACLPPYFLFQLRVDGHRIAEVGP